MRALVDKCAARLPLPINSSSRARSSPLSLTTYFLTATSVLAANQSPSLDRDSTDSDNASKSNDVSH